MADAYGLPDDLRVKLEGLGWTPPEAEPLAPGVGRWSYEKLEEPTIVEPPPPPPGIEEPVIVQPDPVGEAVERFEQPTMVDPAAEEPQVVSRPPVVIEEPQIVTNTPDLPHKEVEITQPVQVTAKVPPQTLGQKEAGAQKQIHQSFADTKQSQTEQVAAQEQSTRAISIIRDQTGRRLEAKRLAQEDANEKLQRELASGEQRSKDMLADIRSGKIRSATLESTPRRLGFAFAAALYQIGSGLLRQTGPNVPLQIFNDTVDQELSVQKALAENRQSAFAANNTLIGQMRARGASQEEAYNLARVGIMEEAKIQIEQRMEQAKTDQDKAGLKALHAEIDKQQASFILQTVQQQRARAAAIAAAHAKTRQQHIDNMLKLQELRLKQQGKKGEEVFDARTGKSLGFISEPVQKRAYDAGQRAYSESLRVLDNLIAAVGDSSYIGRKLTPNAMSETNRKIAQDWAQLKIKKKFVDQMGAALTASEIQLLEDSLGDPFSVGALEKLKRSRARMLETWDEDLRSLGLKPPTAGIQTKPGSF